MSETAGSGRPAPGSGLRIRAARGTIINAGFLVAVNSLGLLRGFLVAVFLSTTEYGVWGVVVVVLATLAFFKRVGIDEKFVQQDEADQELAFRRALTLELGLAAAILVLGIALVPLLAAVIGTPEIVVPALVALLVLPAQALQAPLWIFYREMDFLRQRRLQAIDPIATFVITVGLLAAGVGYWSLIVGVVVAAWLGALVAIRACPYPLRLDFDRATLRSYAGFSWPVFLGGMAAVVTGQGLVIAGEAELGLAGVGIITLTATISQYASRADMAISQTIYPTICAVKDQADLLYEAFAKSNRLAIMWGTPFGLGLAVFAEELVVHVIGEQWRPGIPLMQAVGVSVAVHQIGFNWSAFYRARDETRPIAVSAVIAMAAFLLIAVPLLTRWGLEGLAVAFLILEGISLMVRLHYLRRLFPRLDILGHVARALAPSVPPVALVLAARATLGFPESLPAALALLGLYAAVTVALTAVLERALLREMLGYLRARSTVAA